MVHVSEIDWTNKNIHPSKVVQYYYYSIYYLVTNFLIGKAATVAGLSVKFIITIHP